MPKFKTLKELPGVPVGTIVEQDGYDLYHFANRHFETEYLRNHPDFFKEIKEPKTIFDLKEGDRYYVLDGYNTMSAYKLQTPETVSEMCCFLTEKEALRNQLLRKLATRTDKWLPNCEEYHTAGGFVSFWVNCTTDKIRYHQGLVFRSKEELRKWVSEDEEKLLTEL